MTDPPDPSALPEPDPATVAALTLNELSAHSREQQRKLKEARAREHVGAAGWRQASLLEEIIRAGRDQFASTAALRGVVRLATESLRALPLSAGQESRDEQQRTLEHIVASGHQQVAAAQDLEVVIEQALGEVVATPLSELSARQLERVLVRVREQIRALSLMIEAARAQVGTLTQLQALDELSASYQRQLDSLDDLGTEEELDALVALGERVVERITELDVPGERQLETLSSIAEATVTQVGETKASKDEQVQTLEHLQVRAAQEAERLKEPE